MSYSLSANLFTVLAAATGVFQVALVFGAPWGVLTQGGRFTGALPTEGRIVAAISALLLLAFIRIVRVRADQREPSSVPRFRRLAWVVVAYCALGLVMNAVTPSAVERVLWLPVVALMFVSSLHVARRHPPAATTGAA